MRKNLFFILIFIGVSFLSDQSQASLKTTVKTVKTNGFNVYLINTHRGNGVMAAVNVKTGSAHDPVSMAGRAHMWEHTMFLGSQKYPGRHTFDEISKSLGVDFNAYTSDNHTFYHGYLHPRGLRQWLSLLGATFTNPDWNEVAYLDERDGPVKNEALSYQNQDFTAFFSGKSLSLLNPNHSLAKYDVGSQEQLSQMTLDDMKEYYFSNYTPEKIQVIVSGNFDPLSDGTIPLKEEVVLQFVKESFQIPEILAGFSRITKPLADEIFPPLRSDQQIKNSSPQFFEMKASDPALKYLNIQIQVSEELAKKNYAALETALDYLKSPAPGSVASRLKSEGLITHLNARISIINNLCIVSFDFTLTEKGSQQRYDVPDLLFAELARLEKNDLDEKTLDYLKSVNIKTYQMRISKAAPAAGFLVHSLHHSDDPEKTFDLESNYGRISAQDIRKAATELRSMEKLLVGYLGADVASQKPGLIFSNPIKVFQGTDILSRWEHAVDQTPKNLRLDEVDLKIAAKTTAKTIVKIQNEKKSSMPLQQLSFSKDTAYLEESPDLDEAALVAQLKLSKISQPNEAILQLMNSAFQNRYEGALEYLNSLGIKANILYRSGTLSFSTQGTSSEAKAALTWLLEMYFSFIPTKDEISHAKEEEAMGYIMNQQEFPAHLALQESYALLNGNIHLKKNIHGHYQKITYETAETAIKKLLTKANLNLVLSGNWHEQDAKDIQKEIRSYIPLSLEKKSKKSQDIPISKKAGFFLKRTASDTGIGLVRIYDGPSIKNNLREAAAMKVLFKAMGTAVMQLNRAERQLGYVHNASTFPLYSLTRLFFYGQVDQEDKFPLMEDGWAAIIEKLRNGTLSLDGFESEKKGIINSESILPESPLDSARLILQNLSNANQPDLNKKLLEIIPTLTAEEITATGLKYLDTDRTLTVLHGKKPRSTAHCKEWLTSTRAVRNNLQGK